MGRVQLQNKESNKVLIFEQLTDLLQLRLLLLRCLVECFDKLLVKVSDAFVDSYTCILIFHDPVDQISDYHGFEKNIELHRRFDEQQTQKLSETI